MSTREKLVERITAIDYWGARSLGSSRVTANRIVDMLETEQESVVQRVIDLWNNQNGWIPGGAYERLAEALGVSTDRLVHPGGKGEPRYYPPGVPQTTTATEVKPRDHVVEYGSVDGGFTVAWVNHTEEFYMRYGFHNGMVLRIAKQRLVTVRRGV